MVGVINKLRSWLPISIVVICIIAFLAESKEGADPCSISTTFYNYDLSSLSQQNLTVTYDAGDKMLPIYFSVCSTCSAPKCPYGAAVCIYTDSDVISGGAKETQELSVSDGGEGIKAVYSSGSSCSFLSSWETVINVQCDMGTTTPIISAYTTVCTMNINILSPAGCPVRKNWVLPVLVICTILSLCFAIYLVIYLLRRLLRRGTPSGITPMSPEEVLPLLTPSPTTPSLFINDYIHKKLPDSPAGSPKFSLESPPNSPELAKSPTTDSCVNETPDPDKGTCKICWIQSVDCALVDCGHLMCVKCAANVNTCPFCRRKVITRVKLYYS